MIPLRVTIIEGEGVRKLARIRGRFANYRPVFEGPVLDLLRDFFRQQFRTRGRHGGTPWARLKRSTLAIKRRLGFGNKPAMVRTGRLYRAYTQAGRVRGRQVIIRAKKGMVFRITLDHGRLHQEGTENMVARTVLPDTMPEQFMVQLRNIISGYLVEGQFR